MHEDYTDRLLHVIDYHIRQATVAYAGQQRLGSLCAHYGNSRTAQGQGYAEGYLVALRRMHRLIRRADSAPPLAIGQLLLLECGKWQRDAEVHRLFSDPHFSDSAYCRGRARCSGDDHGGCRARGACRAVALSCFCPPTPVARVLALVSLPHSCHDTSPKHSHLFHNQTSKSSPRSSAAE
ncbi:MAG: hypothetical protein IPK16_15800 [Anaerolineales bacterium]|nr:hypothetical protein [Anaerolineales bacterium]